MDKSAINLLSVDVESLRQKVIDAAVRGQLTKQLPSDGNAEDLYNQIQAEKAKLIKEGKIKKFKPLPPIDPDEVPFDIPDNWKWVRLGDIFTTTTGATPPKNNDRLYGKQYPLVKPSEIYDDRADIGQPQDYLSDEGWARARHMEPGSVLVCCIGSIGKAGILRKEATANQQINAILNNYLMDMEFVYYGVKSSFFKSNLVDKAAATTISIVNKTKFDECIIPLPPLAEQKRIVERIDEILELLDVISRGARAYRADASSLKSKLIDAVVRGQLTKQLPSDGNAEDLYNQIQAEKAKLIKEGKIKKFKPLPPIDPDEVPFDIPENWRWVRLGDIVKKEIKRGKSPSYGKSMQNFAFAQKCNTKSEGINFKLAKSIDDISAKKYSEMDIICAGDIIINSTGTGTLGRVGIVKEVPQGKKYYADSHVTLVRTPCNSTFIYFALKSQERILISLGTGTTNQRELKAADIVNLLIPLPPLAEQKRIVEVIGNILNIVGKQRYAKEGAA